ncbi:MAG: urease accessory protein UreD [Chitinophagaceae bacterium]|nr:MAG: urease accessory protein UreD [Chitinophagaceae bacterium]
MTSNLTIQVSKNGERTILKNCFFNPPYKIADITEDKKKGTLHLMLMSSSPGVLDNDSYDINIEVEADCDLQMHTQSYQRIFTMKQQASQKTTVTMGINSSVCFIPHPVVPHKDSSFVADTHIFMEENASLVWGEIISCGRKLNGEVFQFQKYHSRLSVFYGKRLVLKENLLLEPALVNPTSIGQFQHFTHQATLFFLNDRFPVETLKKKISAELAGWQNISFGITKTAFNGLFLRILGQQSEQLFDCLKLLSQQILLTVQMKTSDTN